MLALQKLSTSVFIMWGIASLSVFRLERCLLLQGSKCSSSSMVKSVGGKWAVRYPEVVHFSEGPLIQVLLYTTTTALVANLHTLSDCKHVILQPQNSAHCLPFTISLVYNSERSNLMDDTCRCKQNTLNSHITAVCLPVYNLGGNYCEHMQSNTRATIPIKRKYSQEKKEKRIFSVTKLKAKIFLWVRLNASVIIRAKMKRCKLFFTVI